MRVLVQGSNKVTHNNFTCRDCIHSGLYMYIVFPATDRNERSSLLIESARKHYFSSDYMNSHGLISFYKFGTVGEKHVSYICLITTHLVYYVSFEAHRTDKAASATTDQSAGGVPESAAAAERGPLPH